MVTINGEEGGRRWAPKTIPQPSSFAGSSAEWAAVTAGGNYHWTDRWNPLDPMTIASGGAPPRGAGGQMRRAGRRRRRRRRRRKERGEEEVVELHCDQGPMVGG
eukprot:2783446-Pyramimonas_sp.AAC.2